MLLKGSDCTFHDLDVIDQLAQSSPGTHLPATLVLREWFNLDPAHEFRCFVRDQKLIAVSSRSSTFYDFLIPQEVQRSILDRIRCFFELVLSPNFSLADFVFDVYLKNPTKVTESSTTKPNLKLIDINPFASYIDPCLFSYVELDQLHSSNSAIVSHHEMTSPILKVVESEHPHQNIRATKFQTSKLPLEFLRFPQNCDVNELSEKLKTMSGTEES